MILSRPSSRGWLLIVFLLLQAILGGIAWSANDADIHTFTGPNGATLEAEVLDMVDGKVKIRRLSDQMTFELPANRLAPADVDFMRAWLERREAGQHPLGWKRLRIHLPAFADEVEAPGIPAAFRRIDARSWEAELPPGAWVLVKIFREKYSGIFAPQFLLPWDGESEWFLNFGDSRLYRGTDAAGEKILAGLVIGSLDGDAELRDMKKEIPAEGVALASEYLEANDFSRLGDGVISAVVEEIDSFDVARGAKLRALRMEEVMRETAGLSGYDELELLDVRCTGGWPLADCASLKGVTTLVVDGEVSLASASAGGSFPALRHLSLQEAEIADEDQFAGFVGQLGGLNSLSLPDESALNLAGLAACPNLTVLEIGDRCGDPAAQGLAALKNLSVLLMKSNYPPSDFTALVEQGHFAKLRTLGAYQVMPFADFPQLRELWLKARINEDDIGIDFASAAVAVPERVTHLGLRNATAADLQALGASDRIQSLTLRYPSLIDLDPLLSLGGLAWLRIEDQLVTVEEKLESLDTSGFPALRGLSLLRLQNLTTLGPAAAKLEGLGARSCSELKQLDPSLEAIADKVILTR